MDNSADKPGKAEASLSDNAPTVGRPKSTVHDFEPNTIIYETEDEANTPAMVSRRLVEERRADEERRKQRETPSTSPESQPLPISQVAHFKIIGRIGQGGMGTVFRARDEYLQRMVALKVIGAGRDQNIDEEQTQRLLREARAASRISHPNVVTVYAAGEHEGVSFIAMEYVEGKELADIIGAGGLDAKRALQLAVQICEGLGAAHEQGIVHRDIKPANVLVLKDDHVKILDFGLAKPAVRLSGDLRTELAASRGQLPDLQGSGEALNVYQTQTGVVWGSLHYMSPEQACGDPLDARTDLFSLGVVMYQLLTGRLPWLKKKAMEQLQAMMCDEPPRLSELRIRIPDAVQAIVDKALAKDRDLRYASAEQMASDIRTALRRLQDFGDVEFESTATTGSLTTRPTAPAATTTPQTAVAPKPAPKPQVRYDQAFSPDTVAFQPEGAQFDVVIVSENTYPWVPKRLGNQGSVVPGTAVSIRDDVYEVVGVERNQPPYIRYFLKKWDATKPMRRVVAFTPGLVAAAVEERRQRSGALGAITAFFTRKRRD